MDFRDSQKIRMRRPATVLILAGLLAVAPFFAARTGEAETLEKFSQETEKVVSGPKIHKPGTPPPAFEPHGPLAITIEDALLLTLENNRSLTLERLTAPIRGTYEDEERAVFDPVLGASLEYSRGSSEELSRNLPVVSKTRETQTEGRIGVSRFYETGTDVELNMTSRRTWTQWYSDWHEQRIGLNVTQALLRGRGVVVNLARLRQAEIDSRASIYELRGFAETLTGLVEKTYWEYALSERRIRIFEASLEVVDQQLRETEEMINVGKLAETELTAVEAEKALRRQDLINARSELAIKRLQLIRLINPTGPGLWDREIRLVDRPVVPNVTLEAVEPHVKLALRFRPDLNQARLGVSRGDIEIVRTRNGLLPKMDLFITLGKSGYADSFSSSISDITDDSYDALVGLTFQYPFKNRGAEARHQRAVLSKNQALKALENLSQLVEMDVRSAYIEVNRAKEQISATSATRELQEEKLRIEAEKFRVGRSTNFLLAQVHRDLVSSQISEVEAVVSYLKALVELHRLEGSLLERRGIQAPGRDPVEDE